MRPLWAGNHLDGYLVISIDGTSPNEQVFFSMRSFDSEFEGIMNEVTIKLAKEDPKKAIEAVLDIIDTKYKQFVLQNRDYLVLKNQIHIQ